jgi:vancomycin resistance protein YoaR
LRSDNYLSKLERGLAQVRAGQTVVKTMDELEAMAEDDVNGYNETLNAIEEVQKLKANPNKKTYSSFTEILEELDEPESNAHLQKEEGES